MSSVLIIEDDLEIIDVLNEFLMKKGNKVTWKTNGLDGLSIALNNEFDIVLLDIMIPYKSGDILLEELRQVSDVPVIVLSAKESTQTKINLLNTGADDYLTKPFDLEELYARMERCLVRCSNNDEKQFIQHGNIRVDIESKLCFIDENELKLTLKEYEILLLLIKFPQKTFSKANIYESVWKQSYIHDDSVLNVHLSNLRAKIKQTNNGKDVFETIWGIGYRIKKL